MLEINNLSFSYPDGSRALEDINMTLPREHILAVLGESGSGKTTLLMCIGRFLKPRRGSITIDGEDISGIEHREFRRRIGIVFQQLYLFPHLTVLENMMLAPEKVLKQPKKAARKEALDTIGRLGIGELGDKYPSQISGGQAQRAAIARALVLKPSYLLLDEPTSALDLNTTREFGRWLVELKETTTFVIVTHDVPFAEKTAGSGFLMADGRLRAVGTLPEILKAINQPLADK
jgi:ABC-type polar amino acid transport system ATPase subunit